MIVEKKKKGGKKGGRGCKILIISSILFLASCTVPVKMVPSDDQITKVTEIVQNQGLALQEIIKILQANGTLPKPEEKK